MYTTNKLFQLVALFVSSLFISCGGGSESESSDAEAPKSMVAEEVSEDPLQNKGIGPVKSVTLGETVDEAMAEKGAEIFNQMCSACHKAETRYIGPAPKDILSRRSPEWVMNMILNPDVMIVKDPIAKKLLAEYNGAPMANQNLTEEQARDLLEYFRTL